jgi:hypothetical protein
MTYWAVESSVHLERGLEAGVWRPVIRFLASFSYKLVFFLLNEKAELLLVASKKNMNANFFGQLFFWPWA